MPLFRPAAVGAVLALLAASGPAQEPPTRKDRTAKGEAWEQEQFEEKMIARAAERATKAADSEAARWHRELGKAFPALPSVGDRIPRAFETGGPTAGRR